MKKCICIILVIAVSILSGCNSSQNEENVFPQNFKEYYEVSPYGNEEEINSLSDVEITLDKKWDFNLENATFFIENNSDKEYHCSKSYFEIEAEQSDVWYQLTQLSDPSKNNEDDVIIKPSERLRLDLMIPLATLSMITKSLSERLSSCFSNCRLLVLLSRSDAGKKNSSTEILSNDTRS